MLHSANWHTVTTFLLFKVYIVAKCFSVSAYMKTTVKVADIKKYIKSGGSIETMTRYLGYTGRRTIEMWIYRNSIPRWQQKKVLEFFNSNERHSS